MAKQHKKQELVGKNMGELSTLVVSIRKEIMDLQMENAKGQLKQTTSLRTKKDELARALTQLNMQKFASKQQKGEKK